MVIFGEIPVWHEVSIRVVSDVNESEYKIQFFDNRGNLRGGIAGIKPHELARLKSAIEVAINQDYFMKNLPEEL